MHKLTNNQERYIFAELASPYAFFIGVWYEVMGTLDGSRLRSAISAALSRHTGCRISFRRSEEGDYHSVVEAKPAFLFYELDAPNLHSETIERETYPYLKKLHRFDELADFHRFFILNAGDGRQALVLCQHHAVSDGQSLDIISKEIAQIYSDPAGSLPAARAFHDFTSEALASPGAEEYWKEHLSGIEDVPYFHRNQTANDVKPRRLARATRASNSAAASLSEQGLTLFSTIAASFAAQVAQQTRLTNAVFSIQSAGRYGFSDAVVTGSFSNALPISVEVNFEESFIDLAGKVQNTIRKALTHEALGYHHIQRLTGVRPDFALNLYPTAPNLTFGETQTGPRHFLTSQSDYGVNLRWHRSATGALNAEAYFDAAKIEPERISTFLDRAIAIHTAATAHPNKSVADLLASCHIFPPLKSKPEVAADPSKKLPRLFDLFFSSATLHASRTAIHFDDEAISYDSLLTQVEDRASRLYAGGVRAGMNVGFLADRSADFVINMLALSRIGAAFASLDTEYPIPRILELTRSLACDYVFTSNPEHLPYLEKIQNTGIRVINTEIITNDLEKAPKPKDATEQVIAYYLFTSGTTGLPKAVGVGHGALPQFLNWQVKTFGVSPSDKITMMSGLAHDPVLRDVFLPLLHGAELTIPQQAWLRSPRDLGAWLYRQRPTILHTTPAIGQLLSEVSSGKPELPGTRIIFWGGDMLPGNLVGQFDQANPEIDQINFYGATETPQAAMFYRHDRNGPPVQALPVGTAIDGVFVEVIGKNNQQLDVNELGEIRIHTPYSVQLNGQNQTGQIYDTGDLGYRLPDGTIQLVGRQDDQVSVRGYRVELSDVERHLAQIDGVHAACALAEKDEQGRNIIFAHVATDPAKNYDDRILRELMQNAVPSYMVPTVFLIHEYLPQLPNGKRDRASLRRLQKAHHHTLSTTNNCDDDISSSRRTPTELAVIKIFEQVTALKVTNTDQSFIDIGADSLNYIQAMLRLEAISRDLPSNWPNLPIRLLAQHLNTHECATNNKHSAPPSPLRLVKAEIPPLLRAIAILSVVALHLGVGSIGGGGTFLLFMLSGYSLYRFQLPNVLSTESVRVILKPLFSIIVATTCVGLCMGLAKHMQNEPFNLATLFFTTNFLDFSNGAAERGGIVWLWFIACYVQITLIFCMLLALNPIRQILRQNLPLASTIIFITSVIVKFGVIGIFSPEMLLNGVPSLHPWNYAPTTHIPTVILGGIVYLSASKSYPKIPCMALTFAYAIFVGYIFNSNQPIIFLLAVTVIVFEKSIPMPLMVYKVLLSISEASLYLYLLHNPIFSFLRMAHVDLSPTGYFLLIVSAIVGVRWVIGSRKTLLLRASPRPRE